MIQNQKIDQPPMSKRQQYQRIIEQVREKIPETHRSLQKECTTMIHSLHYRAPELLDNTVNIMWNFIVHHIVPIQEQEQEDWVHDIQVLWNNFLVEWNDKRHKKCQP